jgi:hypothetical protein
VNRIGFGTMMLIDHYHSSKVETKIESITLYSNDTFVI